MIATSLSVSAVAELEKAAEASVPAAESNIILGSWSALGHADNIGFAWLDPGLNQAVYTLAEHNGYLYAGGLFDDTGGGGDRHAQCDDTTIFGLQCIARHSMDDTASPWEAVGGGFNNTVDDMVVMGGQLYVSGLFDDTIGGTGNKSCDDSHVGGLNCIAVLNDPPGGPLTWGSLGNNGLNGKGQVMAVLADDTLIIGGGFLRAGNMPIIPPDFVPSEESGDVNQFDLPGLAAWNRTSRTWSQAGVGGFQRSIVALVTDGATTAYVGGEFERDYGITMMSGPFVIEDSWSGMADGFSFVNTRNEIIGGRVDALAMLNGRVYAGGYFDDNGTRDDTPSLNSIAAWTGSAWQPLGNGLNFRVNGGAPVTSVRALTADDTRGLLYVGGTFNNLANSPPVGCTLSGRLRCVTVWDSGIDQFIPFQWDTGDDSNGLTGEAHDFVLNGSDVYVGGNFNTNATGRFPFNWNLKNVGKWTWMPPTGTVNASAPQGGSVEISGTRFIGVPTGGTTAGVRIGTTQVSFTRSSTTSITATVPSSLAPGTYTISVNGVGGWGNVGTVVVTSSAAGVSTPETGSPPTKPIINGPTSTQLQAVRQVRPNRVKALSKGVPTGTAIVLVGEKLQRNELAVTQQGMTVRTGPITAAIRTQSDRGSIQKPVAGALSIPLISSSDRQPTTSSPKVQLTSSGNAALTPLRIFLIPQPKAEKTVTRTLDLGYLMTDSQGRLQGSVRVLTQVAGSYILQINGAGNDGQLRSINLPVTVKR